MRAHLHRDFFVTSWASLWQLRLMIFGTGKCGLKHRDAPCLCVSVVKMVLCSEMTGVALQELAAADFADELAVAGGDFSADGHHAGAAFELPAFECAVVDIHGLIFSRESATIVRIEDHEIGVAAGLNRSLAGEEIEELGDLGARRV